MKFNLMNTLKHAYGTVKFAAREHAPAICLVTGVGCVIAGTVTACIASTKLGDVVDNAKTHIDNINSAIDNGYVMDKDDEGNDIKVPINEDEYSKKDAQKDKLIVFANAGGNIIKKYALPATLTAIGIVLICHSHKIMSNRLVGVTAAYEGCREAFKSYRNRVKEEYGEEKERELYYGYKKVSSVDPDSGEIKEEVKYSPDRYENTFFFTERTSKEWEHSSSYNKVTIKNIENQANDRYNTYGYVMLFEVLDMLGMDRTPESYMLGWKKGNGSDFISFGVFEGFDPRNQEFINGLSKDCVLHFNVDGIIGDIGNVKIHGPYTFKD